MPVARTQGCVRSECGPHARMRALRRCAPTMISRVFIIAVASILGLLLFIATILRPLPISDGKDPRAVWRKGFRIALVAILVTGAGCAIWGFFIEPDRLLVHYDTIAIDSWPKELSGIRIAMIGDVHTDRHYINEAKLQRIVDLTNQQNPDLVVLLG